MISINGNKMSVKFISNLIACAFLMFLKVFEVLDIPWWLVFMPIWIIPILVGLFALYVLTFKKKDIEEMRRRLLNRDLKETKGSLTEKERKAAEELFESIVEKINIYDGQHIRVIMQAFNMAITASMDNVLEKGDSGRFLLEAKSSAGIITSIISVKKE